MIQKIEELSMNALPALSTVLVNGWILMASFSSSDSLESMDSSEEQKGLNLSTL